MKDLFDNKHPEALWMELMRLGEKTGCHQRPDRSFFIKGYQLPVCARCTGVLLGYLLAIPRYAFLRSNYWAAVLGCIILFTDWLLQALKIKESTNLRRLITGMLGGYGLMSLQMELFRYILLLIRSRAK